MPICGRIMRHTAVNSRGTTFIFADQTRSSVSILLFQPAILFRKDNLFKANVIQKKRKILDTLKAGLSNATNFQQNSLSGIFVVKDS